MYDSVKYSSWAETNFIGNQTNAFANADGSSTKKRLKNLQKFKNYAKVWIFGNADPEVKQNFVQFYTKTVRLAYFEMN